MGSASNVVCAFEQLATGVADRFVLACPLAVEVRYIAVRLAELAALAAQTMG